MLSIICRRWWILLLRGLCAIAIGIMAIAWPGPTILALVWLFAIFLIADGIAGVALGLRGEADGTVWWTMVLLGTLAIVAGLVVSALALTRPGLTLATVMIVMGASAIVRGLFEIVAAIRLRKLIDDEWLLGLSGALSIVFGILIAAWPGVGVRVIGILIGALMVTLGIIAVALSLRLRGLGRQLTEGMT
jgi:uncharacterized membrane protein HdeD (DUF308 family)